MLSLSINTLQHLNSTTPVYRLTSYKVTVTTVLSTGLEDTFRTSISSQSGGMAEKDMETSPKPNSISWEFLLHGWARLPGEAKALLLQGRIR